MTAKEIGVWKRFDRETLMGKSPERWWMPLLNVISLRLNEYGQNEEFQSTLGPVGILCSDGGLTGRNGSDGTAGTWGVCAIRTLREDDYAIPYTEKGMSFPSNFGSRNPEYRWRVTSNQSEYFAACMALSLVPDGWDGRLILDSEVTADRLIGGYPFAGIGSDDLRAVRVLLIERVNCTIEMTDGDNNKKAKGEGGPECYGNWKCDQLAIEAKKDYLQRVESGEWEDVINHGRIRAGLPPIERVTRTVRPESG